MLKEKPKQASCGRLRNTGLRIIIEGVIPRCAFVCKSVAQRSEYGCDIHEQLTARLTDSYVISLFLLFTPAEERFGGRHLIYPFHNIKVRAPFNAYFASLLYQNRVFTVI